MDTTELVDALAKDLKPVTPLAAAPWRALKLCLLTPVLVLSAIMILGGPRPDWLQVMHTPALMAEDLMILAAGVLAACAAAVLAVPDARLRLQVRACLGLATVLWVGLCVGAALTLTAGDARLEIAQTASSAACVRGLALLTAMPLLVAFTLALRGAPVWRGWSGYALTLSMASFGAFGMRFLCPSDAPSHLLLWHFLPVVLLAGIGTLLGKLVLRFR